jgi:hypothetical protein
MARLETKNAPMRLVVRLYFHPGLLAWILVFVFCICLRSWDDSHQFRYLALIRITLQEECANHSCSLQEFFVLALSMQSRVMEVRGFPVWDILALIAMGLGSGRIQSWSAHHRWRFLAKFSSVLLSSRIMWQFITRTCCCLGNILIGIRRAFIRNMFDKVCLRFLYTSPTYFKSCLKVPYQI